MKLSFDVDGGDSPGERRTKAEEIRLATFHGVKSNIEIQYILSAYSQSKIKWKSSLYKTLSIERPSIMSWI